MTTSGPSRSGGSRFVFAAIAALMGLVFLLQGIGVLPGSIMSGDPFWALVGAVLIVGAAAYAMWPRLRRR